MSQTHLQMFRDSFSDFADLFGVDAMDKTLGGYYSKILDDEDRPKEMIPAKITV